VFSIEKRGLRAAWLVLVGVAFLTRLPALIYSHAIDDENMYAAVGVELVHGGLPYVSAIERKPPLLLWIYGATLQVVGDYNWQGLHVAATLWLIASMFGLYRVGRALWDDAAGLIAAFLYAVFMPWGTFKNLAWNGEMLMNLPIVLALMVLVRKGSQSQPSVVASLGAGALIGIATLLKQPAAISIAALALYVAVLRYAALQPGPESRIKAAVLALLSTVWLGLGFVSVLGAMAFVLAQLGILPEALYWSVFDHDVPHGPLDVVFWKRALPATLGFAAACAPLLWGSYRAAARGGEYFSERRAELSMLLCLLGVSVLGAAASGRFYPHYYLQLLPALCLLCAPVAARLYHARATPEGQRRWRMATAYVAVNALVFVALHTNTAVRGRGLGETATYVREHCGAEDRMFVWGQSPEMYVDGRCRPASRYVATFPLTGYIFASPLNQDPNYDTSDRVVPGSWAILERELREHPPELIVDTDGAREVPRYPIRNQPLLRRTLDSSYTLALRASDGLIYRRTAAAAALPVRGKQLAHARRVRKWSAQAW
jgi:4-amino-4-deoxy-L-arabinose transferase-like glycosyltransferase